MLRSILLAACLVVLAHPAQARLVREWSYEQLLAAADVVVVAKPVSNRPAPEKWAEPHGDGSMFEAVDTRFDVRWVIKGPPELKVLTVLHFRYGRKTTIVNGALFVHFVLRSRTFQAESMPEDKDTKPSRSKMTLPAPEYLLFLKRRSDGRMECVTGQYDAVLSCREMSEPPFSIFSEFDEATLGKE